MIETVHHTIRLREGATLRIRDGAGSRLLATRGRIRIAQEGEPRDTVLEAGGSLDLGSTGLTLVQAERASVIAMVAARANHRPQDPGLETAGQQGRLAA